MSESELTIAVEGCCHGELDKIYATIKYLKQAQNIEIDLLICCGDFQAVRNAADLTCLACPPKYRDMNTFYKYYSGESKAPVPTLFIGGNHEAINHLTELYYGGWVAPNIYFLGFSGVVSFEGIRIGGLSGIYTKAHYKWNHQELPPYDLPQLKSAYHLRQFDVHKIMQLDCKNKMDIFLSHDWPAGIIEHGNLRDLLRRKAFLQKEIERGDFGSPPATDVLDYLKPQYWFSAHMHTKFSAVKNHKTEEGRDAGQTKFLALDKCLPRREFLQVLKIPGAKGPKVFKYDPEWLAIVHATHNHLKWGTYGNFQQPAPLDLGTSRNFIDQVFEDLTIPQNFSQTVPLYRNEKGKMPRKLLVNPQTTEFLQKLGLENDIGQTTPKTFQNPQFINEEEIKLSEDDSNAGKIRNEEEIDLNLSGDEDSNSQNLINQEELHIDDLDDDEDGDDDDNVDDIIDAWEDGDEEDNQTTEKQDISKPEEQIYKNIGNVNNSNIVEIQKNQQNDGVEDLQEIGIDKQQIEQFHQQESKRQKIEETIEQIPQSDIDNQQQQQ